MKKSLTTAIVIMLASTLFFSCQKKEAPAAKPAETKAEVTANKTFHIGIVTGTVSQSEDDLRGAEELIKRYGKVSEGGMIQHITYPDDFMSQQETTISQIVALADDPLMKAIVVNQAVPGTTEAFKRVKEKRNDILCFAGEPHEDPGVIQTTADLAVNSVDGPLPLICRGWHRFENNTPTPNGVKHLTAPAQNHTRRWK